jgi:hypothetical protein
MKNNKTVSIRTVIILSSKNCKVFTAQNIFTHSFVSIDVYPMSEVSNYRLEKCKKNIRLKKVQYVKNVYFKEFYWGLNLLRGLP